jgi:hypothetical protein
MRLAPAAMAFALGALVGALVGCPGARSPASVTPCREGTVPLLGACVDPAVGDAWCGPAARMSSAGACVFRECAADEALDLDGSCVPLGLVVRTGPSCPVGAALVVASHHTACIPADDACPRGSHLATSGRCMTARVAGAGPRNANVDIGAWAARVVGASGGPGAPETCRPLAQRPDLFGLTPGQALTVRLRLRISVPDEDLSRIYADVRTQPLPPPAEALVRAAVETSIEALRGTALAGEGPRQNDEIAGPRRSSGTAVDAEVTCTVKSL